jgi:heat shock protein HtpX
VHKTWLLVAVFLAVVLGIGYALSVVYRDPVILIVAIAFSVAMNIAGFWYSDTIALASAHAIPASEEAYPELHHIVENLAITAGLPKPSVYIIPDAVPNAFATGRNAAHASVAVTAGLLEILDRSELEGVIAHELSHIGNNDILLQSMIAVLVGFVAIVADMFTRSLFWGGFGGGTGRRNRDDGEGGGILMVIGIVFIVLSPIIATLIQLAVSRKREYLADASGALLTRYPEGLASALRKIEDRTTMPMKYASGATAHMYISNPFGSKDGNGSGDGKGGVGSWLAGLFATHPPTAKRIAALLGKKVEA